MSITSYNGGAITAMKGKNCVAITADRHFGIQAQMVTMDFQKIFPIGDRLYIGLIGLATDVQTVTQCLKFQLNLYKPKEGEQIKPYTLMSMVACRDRLDQQGRHDTVGLFSTAFITGAPLDGTGPRATQGAAIYALAAWVRSRVVW